MAPHNRANIEITHCAEWYIGPQIPCTASPSSGSCSTGRKECAISVQISGGPPTWASEPRTPLGRPVVPDV